VAAGLVACRSARHMAVGLTTLTAPSFQRPVAPASEPSEPAGGGGGGGARALSARRGTANQPPAHGAAVAACKTPALNQAADVTVSRVGARLRAHRADEVGRTAHVCSTPPSSRRKATTLYSVWTTWRRLLLVTTWLLLSHVSMITGGLVYFLIGKSPEEFIKLPASRRILKILLRF